MDNNSTTYNNNTTQENDQTATNSMVDMDDTNQTTQVDIPAKTQSFLLLLFLVFFTLINKRLKKDFTRIDVVTVQTVKLLSKFWKLSAFFLSIPFLVLFQYNI